MEEGIKFDKAAYPEYLQSPWWKTRRNKFLKEKGRRCFRCGNRKNLNVHHLNYKHLWNELDEDLRVLCYACHCKEHGKNLKQCSKKKRLKEKRKTWIINSLLKSPGMTHEFAQNFYTDLIKRGWLHY
jgi:hypothetical protein